MSNMSYCRFRNTLADLTDCLEALECGTLALDSEEMSAYEELVDICQQIIDADTPISANQSCNLTYTEKVTGGNPDLVLVKLTAEHGKSWVYNAIKTDNGLELTANSSEQISDNFKNSSEIISAIESQEDSIEVELS